MLLRGHGSNAVGSDVRQATVVACLLEEAADLQLRMLSAASGDPRRLRTFSQEDAARLREEFGATGPMRRAWEYYAALTEGRL